MRTIGLLLFLISLTSCNTIDPPPDNIVLTLKLEDVSCTEAWITLTPDNLQLPTTLNLLKDNNLTKIISLQTTDTLLYIDSLLPNQTFKLQASSIQHQVSSNELSVTTMDTTSHNFTWQTWTFGEHSSSTLYDVAIIDENNIWAVGEIYMNDSLGNPDPNAYNAIHWNGSEWSIKKISVEYRGNLITPPLYGIFTISESEIWLSSGVPIRGDGTNWQQYHLFDMGVLTQQDGYLTKIWGSSVSDIYFVGTLGTIAHWNGSKWTKIESGTDLSIYDIWGDYQDITNTYEINLVAAEQFFGPERKLFNINNNNVEELSAANISQGSVHGI